MNDSNWRKELHADRFSALFIDSAVSSFLANKELTDKAIAQLSDEWLGIPLDPNTNSIAIVMKHVTGNLLSRWTDFLTTDGEKPWRNRADEFAETFERRSALLEHWERDWNCALVTLRNLRSGDLMETVTIRGELHSLPLAVHRSLAHCGCHVGQIVMTARVRAGNWWMTLTIPRGESTRYNEAVWGVDDGSA